MSGGINPPKKIKKKDHGDMICKMEIVQFNDGYLEVRGIPASFDMAKNMLIGADQTICNMFIQCAKENKLNDQNVIDGSRIVVAKPNVGLN